MVRSSIISKEIRSSPPDSPDHWFWRLYRSSASHDAGAALRALRVPLLAIWGEHDTAAPPGPERRAHGAVSAGFACTDRTLRVLAGGDHTLLQVEGRDPAAFQAVRRYVPGYFDLMTRWLQERSFAPA